LYFRVSPFIFSCFQIVLMVRFKFVNQKYRISVKACYLIIHYLFEINMNIKLNLRQHCIETEIKKCYHRSVSQYFNSDKNKELLEEQIEMLKTALEQFDFPRLRSKYPELAGHNDAEVFLSKDLQDHIMLILNNRILTDL